MSCVNRHFFAEVYGGPEGDEDADYYLQGAEGRRRAGAKVFSPSLIFRDVAQFG